MGKQEEEIIAKAMKYGGTAFVVIILLVLFAGFIYNVPKGEVGVIYKKAVGVQGFDYQEKGPGMHIKIPFFWSVYKQSFMTRTIYLGEAVSEKMKNVENYATLTPKDMNGINFNQDIAVRFRPSREQLAEFLELKGENINEVVVTALRGTARSVIGKYAQEEVPEKRSEIAAEIIVALQERLDSEASGKLQKGYIIVEAVDIRNTQFDPKIEEKIIQKQEAKQFAEKKQYELDAALKQKEIEIVNAEAVKQAAILKAEGEAEAVLVVATAKAEGIQKVNTAYQRMPEAYVSVKYAEALQANAANGKLMIIDPNAIGLGVMNMNQLLGAGVVG
ncbi:prohibitin family protein [Candidatus Woesearchaeota archaeon]|nr:prohibitin family protein [Candidatus Woesearchaeota archaeon]